MPDSYDKALSYLFQSLNNGYWGYHPNQEPSTEATAWSAIAFSQQTKYEVTKAVCKFLTQSQNEDGGWSTSPKIGKSDWSTGPATLALRLLLANEANQLDAPAAKKSLKQAFNYLFDSRIDFFGPVARLLLLIVQGPAALNYGRGWPWTAKSYNWVEPTSYSLLALKIPNMPRPEEYKFVIEHAHQFLTTHACRDGGWNHGAYYCLEKYAPAYVLTTAEALLALQDLKEHKVVKEGLEFLKRTYSETPTCLSLAWTILVFSAYGVDYQKAVELLQSKQNKDGSFGTSILVTALSATALSVCHDGKHPLLIKPTGSAS